MKWSDDTNMKRRNFLKYGAAGAAAFAVPLGLSARSLPGDFELELTILPTTAELIDGETVYML